MKVGIPALAGLSVLHGLVPPHPGPADRHRAARRRPRPHPAVRHHHRDPDASSSPARCSRSFVDQWVPEVRRRDGRHAGAAGAARRAPARIAAGDGHAAPSARRRRGRSVRQPRGARGPASSRAPARRLRLRHRRDHAAGGAHAHRGDREARRADKGSGVRQVLDVLGTPVVALLIAVIFCYFRLGTRLRHDARQTSDTLGASLPGDRRHHPHRRGGRRLQADARRRGRRQRHRRLGHRRQHVGAPARLARRRRSSASAPARPPSRRSPPPASSARSRRR